MTSQTKTRTWVVALAAVTTAVALACGTAPDSGTVTDRKWEYAGKNVTYFVCATGDDGKEGCDPVGAGIYKSCDIGDAWPACKKDDN